MITLPELSFGKVLRRSCDIFQVAVIGLETANGVTTPSEPDISRILAELECGPKGPEITSFFKPFFCPEASTPSFLLRYHILFSRD